MSTTFTIDQEWENFLNENGPSVIENDKNNIIKENPRCGDLYISTTTRIAFLNTQIDLVSLFWKIPIIEYCIPKEGIIKKQMKFSSTSKEELDNIKNFTKNETMVDEYIITQIINPDGRIKYKDVRKVSIGLSKKDIISRRSKKKGAFYNCFVVILRILWKEQFKEIHIKVFNTGKMEIPGIQDEECLFKALCDLVIILQKITGDNTINYVKSNIETVLINSNFNCGFYINRDTLFQLLKYKYKINCSYDPCSYPGIQCEFYYNQDVVSIQNGQKKNQGNQSKISFMIFRTGSVLIVGKCSEAVLYEIFVFIKNILTTEYPSIYVDFTPIKKSDAKKKIRKKKYIKLTQSNK
jgi:TATA-box binding protein (TBP) (component of TFIID and TFIIIB)